LAALVLAALIGCTSAHRIDLSAISFSPEPLLGKVVWNDLITEDLDAAQRFYGGLFGWTFENTRTGGRPYAIARSNKAYVAGLVSIAPGRNSEQLSRWLPYVSVSDIDDAIDRATAAKANVAVPPRDVPLGRVAAIVDPEGAVIGLARSRIGDPDDVSTRAGVGRVIWTELIANDPQAATEFYRAVFGYDVLVIDRRGGKYTLLVQQGTSRAGILKNPTQGWSPLWLTYFGVDDPAAAASRAESLGGKILLPVSSQIREGTMAVVADPTGAILVLQKVPT
jgi:predicted enzyme related to lactoylglutathione lyase